MAERNEIRFLLGAEECHVHPADPTMTVLEYLRREEALVGTKEGCAEGDCGACTVVLAELIDGDLRYRAVNGCIQFLSSLDGKQLLTVEHLKAADGALHPVQQAMVDHHGSQCGFCTPGFVMSLFAHQAEAGGADRASIDDALAGNLCRCTGYGPIVEAAQAIGPPPNIDGGPLDRATVIDCLSVLSDLDRVVTDAGDRKAFLPRTTDDLADLLGAHPDACIVAGSTDVGLWVTKQHRTLDPVIDITAIPELKRITEQDGVLHIGATATYDDVLKALDGRAPDLEELFRRIGSRQIRNAGTVGGNIANGSPIGDSPPPLIALGATLTLRRGMDRRGIPLEDFFIAYGQQDLRPGEFVEAVSVPLASAATLKCYKISKRFDQDITAVLGAFNIDLHDGVVQASRIAFGGMAATPKRALACEAALIGKRWTAATVEAARSALSQDFQPISDMRASADYRMTVARNMLTKLLVETTEPDTPTRLVGQAGWAPRTAGQAVAAHG